MSKSQGDLMVIETEDDALLGFVEETEDTVTVRTGFVGRPFVLQRWEIESITPAKEHPYVEWL